MDKQRISANSAAGTLYYDRRLQRRLSRLRPHLGCDAPSRVAIGNVRYHFRDVSNIGIASRRIAQAQLGKPAQINRIRHARVKLQGGIEVIDRRIIFAHPKIDETAGGESVRVVRFIAQSFLAVGKCEIERPAANGAHPATQA